MVAADTSNGRIPVSSKSDLDLFAGPGGWSVANRILGRDRMVGVEKNADACETATAAGFIRLQRDVQDFAPRRNRGLVKGVVASAPCPPWSRSGLRKGLVHDLDLALDAITCIGVTNGKAGQVCGCDASDLGHRVADPRSALVVEAARWALWTPGLEWFVAEQVVGCEPLWESLVAELYAWGWEWADTFTVDATEYGSPSRRPRTYLIARHYSSPTVSMQPKAPLPQISMADAMHWEEGLRVWTRNNRRPTGGNAFKADGPSWCLTGSTRTWKVGAVDGPELTAAQAGVLNGFPENYPWRGSRTSQFQRIADVVNAPTGAAVLGVATDTEWEDSVRIYLNELYGRTADFGLAR